MDSYSLLLYKMKRSFNSLPDGNDYIKCMSINDLSLEAGVEAGNLLPLPACFEYLARKHTNKSINMFVDEYDLENLCEKQAEKIQHLMMTETFCNSHVVIVLQSLRKECNFNSMTLDTSGLLEKTGFQTYQLEACMRNTVNISSLIKSLEDKLQGVENVYIPFKLSTTDEQPNSTTSFIDYDSCFNIDTIAANLEETKPIDDSKYQVFHTTFKFHSFASGHSIIGSKPKMLRLNPYLPESSAMICNFLRLFENGLLICDSMKFSRYLSNLLTACNLNFMEYTDSTFLDFPTSLERKCDIYRQWKDGSINILLTDYRGSRGLEHKKVTL